MKSKRALALGLLSGILAACGQPGTSSGGASADGPGATSGTMSTATLGGVTMYTTTTTGPPQHPTSSATGERDGLVVDYVLVNNGTSPVLVHDRVPSDLGSATLPADLNPEHAWAFMSDGRIRLSKQGFAPAPGVRFIAAPVIGARVLEPKQRLTGRAWAPVPLRLDVPSPEFDAPRAPLSPKATTWSFCVQVTVGGSQGAAGTAPSDASVLAVPAAAPNDGELLCSEPWPLPPAASPGAANPSGTPAPN
ncbi:MAG TPA: hypothetical protein VFT81_06390 [Dermatophilaceae bacterium]|nr:hypothetical protein [Dermatophilaceae bacterium]